MHRFLQRVLPNGLVKVRYYGFWAAVNLKLLSHIKDLMGLKEQKKKTKAQGKLPNLSAVLSVITKCVSLAMSNPVASGHMRRQTKQLDC